MPFLKGIPESEILVEANSTTTYENMKFSKEIMDSLRPEGYHAIFASNNYHIFRAGDVRRPSACQSRWDWLTHSLLLLAECFLREYIAILFMHKKTCVSYRRNCNHHLFDDYSRIFLWKLA